MPTLNWIGKEAVVRHHKEVPLRLLEPVPALSCAPADSGNLIMQGDNLWEAAEDDRLIGGLWANLSAGRCRCVMITDRNWDAIEPLLA